MPSAQQDLISDAQALLNDIDHVFPSGGGNTVGTRNVVESDGVEGGDEIDSDDPDPVESDGIEGDDEIDSDDPLAGLDEDLEEEEVEEEEEEGSGEDVDQF